MLHERNFSPFNYLIKQLNTFSSWLAVEAVEAAVEEVEEVEAEPILLPRSFSPRRVTWQQALLAEPGCFLQAFLTEVGEAEEEVVAVEPDWPRHFLPEAVVQGS